MSNIIQICELSGSTVKKIYSFEGNDANNQGSKKGTGPVGNTKIINEYIHGDDSIATIKYKIFSALGGKVAVEEMYLFYHHEGHLNPRYLYNEMTQDDEYSLSSTTLCSFMKNIHQRIKCNSSDDKDYDYDFLLDNINPSKKFIIDKSIGVKCLLKRNLPFIVNPFKCFVQDPKITRNDDNIIQTTNSNLLFQYSPKITRIYLCTADTVLKMNSNVPQHYLLKLYFPLLFREKIKSLETLGDKQSSLIDKNKTELSQSKFSLYNDKVDLFYNMFHQKSSELDYISKGISNIKFTMCFKLIWNTNIYIYIRLFVHLWLR